MKSLYIILFIVICRSISTAQLYCPIGYESKLVKCKGKLTYQCVPENLSCKGCWILENDPCPNSNLTSPGAWFYNTEARAIEVAEKQIRDEKGCFLYDPTKYRIYIDDQRYCGQKEKISDYEKMYTEVSNARSELRVHLDAIPSEASSSEIRAISADMESLMNRASSIKLNTNTSSPHEVEEGIAALREIHQELISKIEKVRSLASSAKQKIKEKAEKEKAEKQKKLDEEKKSKNKETQKKETNNTSKQVYYEKTAEQIEAERFQEEIKRKQKEFDAQKIKNAAAGTAIAGSVYTLASMDRMNTEMDDCEEDHFHLQGSIGLPFHSNPTFFNKFTNRGVSTSEQAKLFSMGLGLGLGFHPFYSSKFHFGVFGDFSFQLNPMAYFTGGGVTTSNTILEYSGSGLSYQYGAELAIATIDDGLKLLTRGSKRYYKYSELESVQGSGNYFTSKDAEVIKDDILLESGFRIGRNNCNFDITYMNTFDAIKEKEFFRNFDIKMSYWHASIFRVYGIVGKSSYHSYPKYPIPNPASSSLRFEFGIQYVMDWFWSK